jgi:hypothetical protein
MTLYSSIRLLEKENNKTEKLGTLRSNDNSFDKIKSPTKA